LNVLSWPAVDGNCERAPAVAFDDALDGRVDVFAVSTVTANAPNF
jgi:hypothetical protein